MHFLSKNIVKDKPVCPADSKRQDLGCGYETLADLVAGFKELGKIPEGLRIDLWYEGNGIAATCRQHIAIWHLKCQSVLHVTALDRLRKRPADDDQGQSSENDESIETKTLRLTRAASGSKSTDFTSLCFFVRKKVRSGYVMLQQTSYTIE